ncbi:hypothetical protein [Streptomyces sp. NPDC056105]|uniref:hypothetical protein n=1 Tax=Streptomyces sp. NPDC056105 TaxID=3345714 RepID=UPI0035E28803
MSLTLWQSVAVLPRPEPPTALTATPEVVSGRLSVAGLIAMHPARTPTDLPSGRQGQATEQCERDFIALIDGAHQLVKASIALV